MHCFEETVSKTWDAVRYYVEKGHKATMTAPCCQGGGNAVLPLPRGSWGAEMVLVRFLGGPAGWLYQILMFLYEIQMLMLGTFVSTSH